LALPRFSRDENAAANSSPLHVAKSNTETARRVLRPTSPTANPTSRTECGVRRWVISTVGSLTPALDKLNYDPRTGRDRGAEAGNPRRRSGGSAHFAGGNPPLPTLQVLV